MNGRHEAVEMGVQPGNPAVPRETWTRNVLEQNVAGGACPELVEGRPEDAKKDAHIRGRSHAKA